MKARAHTLVVMSQDLVQPSLFSSMSTRMSSATAMVGCVSFSWNATLSGKASKSLCVSLYRRTTSCASKQLKLRSDQLLLVDRV